jgi:hypothetical protein
MKTIRNAVSAIIILGTVSCATTGHNTTQLAAASNYAPGEVATVSNSGRLQRSESLACANVTDAERTAPLQSAKVIYVRELLETWPIKGRRPNLEGATVFILASPGLTKEWLGHVLECHMTLPPVSAGADPLTLGNSSVEVSSTSSGFAIDIRSKNWDTAREILRTAQAMQN